MLLACMCMPCSCPATLSGTFIDQFAFWVGFPRYRKSYLYKQAGWIYSCLWSGLFTVRVCLCAVFTQVEHLSLSLSLLLYRWASSKKFCILKTSPNYECRRSNRSYATFEYGFVPRSCRPDSLRPSTSANAQPPAAQREGPEYGRCGTPLATDLRSAGSKSEVTPSGSGGLMEFCTVCLCNNISLF